MGWSTSAPTLPSGSSWTGETSISQIIRNYWKLDCTMYIARLSGQGVAVKCHFTLSAGSYGYSNNEYFYLKEGSSAADTRFQYPSTATTKDIYWTGDKAAGASVSITVGAVGDSSARQTKTLTAPALITYTITYNGNGSTGGSTASQTKTNGVSITLQQNGFTRTGYTFQYWNTKADGSGTTYQAGATYTGNAALSLYAIWLKANIPLYVNVGGTIHQVEKAYVNVGGTIKECTVYANVGGTIKTFV